MSLALRAGLAYVGGVFALAFLFGMLRLLVLTPWLGALVAVAVEVPIILAFAWVLCRRLVQRLQVPADTTTRSVMGASALGVLLVLEFLLGVGVFGESPGAWFARLATPPGALGLAGQCAFGVLPLLQGRRDLRRINPAPTAHE